MRSPGRFHVAVYSDAAVLGGAEVNLSTVLAALPKQIHVTVIGVDAEVVSWLLTHRSEADSTVLPAIRDRTDVLGLWRHRREFARISPDVLQFNLSCASSCQWALLAATSIPGLRRVVVENSPMAVWSSTSGVLKRFSSARLAAHVAVGTRTARMIEADCGLPTRSITTLYHGVQALGHEPVDRTEQPTLFTVARHDPVKGLDVLLDAMASVDPEARLVIVGEGAETERLESQRRTLGLDDRVEFRQIPWDVRVADLMWAFDALVLPSRLEGFPVTVVEAMLAGLPVVATDVGSVDEAVVAGHTGWIVPPEDPDALAEAINELVGNLDRARDYGIKGKARAEALFTIDATVAAYLELYRSLRSGSRRTRRRRGAPGATPRSDQGRPRG